MNNKKIFVRYLVCCDSKMRLLFTLSLGQKKEKKTVLINMVTVLMMSPKMVTLVLLKIKEF